MRNPLRHKRGVALVGALCAAIGLVAAPAAAAAPAVPTLDWQACDSGFFCASATVPLDYAYRMWARKSCSA